MRGKRALVTGSNVGVGYETALALAKAGAHVVLACRNAEKADAAVNAIRKEVDDKVEVEAWSLDLLSLDSVRALAKKWNATERALDLLVLNAGAITLDRSISKDGFEHSYQINCLSHFLLTILLLPSVARSMAPRIVNVTSAACHDVRRPFLLLRIELKERCPRARMTSITSTSRRRPSTGDGFGDIGTADKAMATRSSTKSSPSSPCRIASIVQRTIGYSVSSRPRRIQVRPLSLLLRSPG